MQKKQRLTKSLTLNDKDIIKLAAYGRKGKKLRLKRHNDISALLDFMGKCKQKDQISEIDEFFCLCAVENFEDYHSAQIDLFIKHLCNAASRMTDLISASKLSEKDHEAYLSHAPIIQHHREILQRQKTNGAFENRMALAKDVLFSGIDFDARIGSTPILNEDDKQLSINWIDNISKKQDEKEVKRVLSARAAEKAAKAFYEQCGYTVEDVSINQIKQNKNDAWKHFDLKVNDYLVDVKNSRRSYSSPDRYVEHCVPRFKTVRRKQDVHVAGLLSRYLSSEILLAPKEYKMVDTSLIFLGETTYDEHMKLKNEFSGEYFDIGFGRTDRNANFFLPPWIFNYPIAIYKNRDRAINELSRQGAPDYILCQKKNFNCIPSCLAANINLSEYFSFGAFKAWESELYNTLLNRIQKYGLSLPFIYLSFLSHFAEMICRSIRQQTDYRPNQYRRFVFMNNDEFSKPLGIYDPLYTIRSLIEVLDDLWSANHDLIRLYKYFRLSGFHIFQGKRLPDERWETLIAYCGGWIKEKGKCGNYPLVLGKSVHCEKCKKLICPICGFCSEGCENCYEVNMADHAYPRIEERQIRADKDIPF